MNRIKIFVWLFLVLMSFKSNASTSDSTFHRKIYLSWGYNKDWFTHSNIHLSDPNGYDFVLYHAAAHDRPNFDKIDQTISHLAIPQYNYRIGWYFKNKPNHGIEINFDHTKYVMDDNQTVHMKGRIGTTYFDQDTLVTPAFLHFEHTNGANFFLLNYFSTKNIFQSKHFSVDLIGKAGLGGVVPKTDVTIFGTRLDNKFHLAGWLMGMEGAARFTFFNHVYVETSAKTCLADYVNVLVVGDGRAHHAFGSLELIGNIGYQFSW